MLLSMSASVHAHNYRVSRRLMFEVAENNLHIVGSIRVPSRHRKSLEFQAKGIEDLKRVLAKRLRYGVHLFRNDAPVSLLETKEKINMGRSQEEPIELLLYKVVTLRPGDNVIRLELSKETEAISVEIIPGTRPAVLKKGPYFIKKKWTKKVKRGENLIWSYPSEKR